MSDLSESKVFADDKLNVAEVSSSVCDRVEKIDRKGENADCNCQKSFYSPSLKLMSGFSDKRKYRQRSKPTRYRSIGLPLLILTC